MAGTMLVKEAAECWDLTERRVASLCKEGKIPGVQKQGRTWLIPVDAQRPVDNRVKTGAYRKKKHPTDLPLPIGVSDYRLASSEYYYVDKTMMIKNFIDERPMVSLFTRPRCFGKTLNMDMIRTFFEKTDEDTSVYFQDKKIWSCGQRYRDYQGKYPVLFITFKDVKFNTWEESFAAIKDIFSNDNKYSAYFGFTAREVKEMAAYYGMADKYEEICEWYNGYHFGKCDIFNPWSVINYFNNECEPRAFWQSTGSNDIIGEITVFCWWRAI